MKIQNGIYIDNAWRPSTGHTVCAVINPYTEALLGTATIATEADVDSAVQSSQRALVAGPWRDTSLNERIAMVLRIRDGLLVHRKELARLAAASMGVPYASYLGLANSVELIDMYIDMVRRVRWEYLRMDATGDSLITRRPVGVVAAIVPWNAPIRSEIKKVIPALLTGCTVVVKPAPETPFGAALLAQICSDAGVPPGVVNLVPGDGTTGELLIKHPSVRKIAFTGSSDSGSKIWTSTANTFKRLQLELGGKSAAIVVEDVDIPQIAPWLSMGIFAGAGQNCAATSRILAPRTRYREVVDAVAEAAHSHVLGDPFNPATTLGPLVTERQRTRVLGYIETGKAEGAKLVAGGSRPHNQAHGWFVEPTVFAEVDNSMRIAQEEIFGPVVSVIPYDGDDDAVRLANDSQYGLGGAVYSSDPHRALNIARRIDSGYIAVNRFGVPSSAPFGGVKQSGSGREHGLEGYDSFLEYVAYPLTHDFAEELAKTIPGD